MTRIPGWYNGPSQLADPILKEEEGEEEGMTKPFRHIPSQLPIFLDPRLNTIFININVAFYSKQITTYSLIYFELIQEFTLSSEERISVGQRRKTKI